MDSLGLMELIKAKNQTMIGKPDDPITIFTLISEMQREIDNLRKQGKSLED